MRRNNLSQSQFDSQIEHPFDFHLRLLDPAERDRTGLFVAYGPRFLIAAIEAGCEIVSVILRPGSLSPPLRKPLFQRIRSARIPLTLTTVVPTALSDESGEPPAVVVIVRQHWRTLPDIVHRSDLWLGVEHLRTPGNVGTLMRSAVAAGAKGLIVFGPARDRTDPFDPTSVRASMGAIFGLHLVKTSHREFRHWSGRSEISVFGATGDTSLDYRSVDYRRPVVIMLGNERSGLSEAQRTTCDRFIRIPMVPGIDSLNVAMAGTVLLYEAYGQRHPVRRTG